MKTDQSLSVKTVEGTSPVERANLPAETPYIIICFTSWGDGIPAGELYNAYLSNPVPFAGLTDMILKMDGVYDFLDFPQSDREPPPFGKQPRWDYDRLAPYEPRYFQRHKLQIPRQSKLILSVHTRFRQNGSWQGTLRCPTTKQTANYVSTLQFLKLAAELVEAVSGQEASNGTQG